MPAIAHEKRVAIPVSAALTVGFSHARYPQGIPSPRGEEPKVRTALTVARYRIGASFTFRRNSKPKFHTVVIVATEQVPELSPYGFCGVGSIIES
jgi:hypothetical protein